LGMISPKRSMRNVITITSTINPSNGVSVKSNSLVLRNADNITIATFTVLFPTRIVLRSCSGLLKSLITIDDLLDLSDLILPRSAGPREKYATSEADISAEARRSRIRKNNPVMVLRSIDPTLVSAK